MFSYTAAQTGLIALLLNGHNWKAYTVSNAPLIGNETVRLLAQFASTMNDMELVLIFGLTAFNIAQGLFCFYVVGK